MAVNLLLHCHRQPKMALAQIPMVVALAPFLDETSESAQVVLPTQLVIRTSCGFTT